MLDMGNFITGPYAGMLLADLGAEVIKVERPGSGDAFRSFKGGLYSPHFQAYNRNKKSLTLNVNNEKGKKILLELIKKTDVFIENFRPGVTAKLGIDEKTLRSINRKLVYCSITGFGRDGPYVHRPSYDTVAQGLSGMLSLFLDKSNPRIIGPAFSDGLTGLYACYGILAALIEREKTGFGRIVETNMLESTLHFMTETYSSYFVTNDVPGSYSRAIVSQSYSFVCEDGLSLAIHLSSPTKFWESLLIVVGKEAMNADPRFDSRERRIQNYEQLQQELAVCFRRKPRAYWIERLETYDVPFTPVYTTEEVVTDSQVKHLDTIYEVEHRTEGSLKGIKSPIYFNGSRNNTVKPPPVLGENTEEILNKMGLSQGEIQSLRVEGVI